MAANLIPTITSPPIFQQQQQQQQQHSTTINTHIPSPLFKPLIKAKARLGPLCSSPSPSPLIEEDEAASTQAGISIEDADMLPFRGGCKACGREEIERGCNGEGRIQGGIAAVPGFGWWPIKAYRPCPGFVECGGRYRRRGQSMDEVAWGRTDKDPSMVSLQEIKSSKKTQKSKE